MSQPSSVKDITVPFDPDEDIQRRLKKLRENGIHKLTELIFFASVSTSNTRKVKVLSLPQTIKEKSTFRAKAPLTPDEGPSLKTSIFPFSGSERTFTFRVSLNTLPTLATLVQDISTSDSNAAS